MEYSTKSSFGSLLRRYRKFSGFITLQQFTEAMETYGLFYEHSLICKWEKNARKPRSRNVLIQLIRLFCERGVLVYIEQAQEFAQAAGFGFLTDEEIANIADLRWTDHQKNVFPHDSDLQSSSTAALAFLSTKNCTALDEEIESRLTEILNYLQTSWKVGDCTLVLELWQKIGPYLWNTGRWDDMRKYGMYAFHCAKNCTDESILATVCLRDLCWLYFWQGDLDSASRFVSLGEEISIKINDSKLTALAALRGGKIHQARGEFFTSIKDFNSSINYYRNKSPEVLGDIYTYLGESYWLAKDITSAEKFFKKALEFVDKYKDLAQKSIIFTRLGGIMFRKKKLDIAADYFILSMELEKGISRRAGGQFWNNLGLGLIYFKQENISLSKKHFEIAKLEQAHLGMSSGLEKVDPFLLSLMPELEKSGYFS